MPKVRVNAFSVSIDGYGAGPDQSLEHPIGFHPAGVHGTSVHDWMRETKMFHTMIGKDGGTTDVDHDIATRSMEGIGAWILGRNMFGPIRGDWPDDQWKGWWGATPPYHTPVFVLTHYERAPIEMDGGTVFHFVTEGADVALQRAKEAAGDKDVRIGGGVSTVRQYLEKRQIDEMNLVVAPVLLGKGEALLAGLDLLALGYRMTRHLTSPNAMHVTIDRNT